MVHSCNPRTWRNLKVFLLSWLKAFTLSPSSYIFAASPKDMMAHYFITEVRACDPQRVSGEAKL